MEMQKCWLYSSEVLLYMLLLYMFSTLSCWSLQIIQVSMLFILSLSHHCFIYCTSSMVCVCVCVCVGPGYPLKEEHPLGHKSQVRPWLNKVISYSLAWSYWLFFAHYIMLCRVWNWQSAEPNRNNTQRVDFQ